MAFSIGGLWTDIMGGHNDFQAGQYKADPNAFMWGNNPYQADTDVLHYNTAGGLAAGRKNYQYGPAAVDSVDQNAYIRMLQGAAAGQGPSQAQMQLERGNQAALAATSSMAAGARGGGANLAAAQRLGAEQRAAQMASNAGAAAQLRQQEMQQAYGQLGQGLQARGAYNLQRAGTGAQLGLQNQALNDQMTGQYLQAAQDVRKNQLQGSIAGESQMANNFYEPQRINAQTAQANANADKEGGKGVLGLAAGALGMFSDERMKKDVEPSSSNDVTKMLRMAAGLSGGSNYDTGYAFGSALHDVFKSNPNAAGGYAGAYKGLTDEERDMASMAGDSTTDTGVGGNYASFLNPETMKAAAPLAMAAMSDRKLKTGIQGADSQAEKFLDGIHPYTYEYKNPAFGEGRRMGVMAQDVEKSPMGATMVQETPYGKALNMQKGMGVMLAAQADLNKRLRALEGKK